MRAVGITPSHPYEEVIGRRLNWMVESVQGLTTRVRV